MYCPRVNANVNHEVWVIVMCRCMFISCNKCTTLVGMLTVEEAAMPGWGQKVYGNSLYFPLDFAVNLKLL